MFTFEDLYNDIVNGASMERIRKKYGKTRLYIAERSPNYKEKLRKEFNGYNFDQLAYKYNLSTSHVRQIVKEGKDQHTTTPSLFD